MSKLISLLLFVFIILVSCNEISYVNEADKKSVVFDLEPITPYTWFLGSWQNDTKVGIYREEWKQQNDTLYVGESYIVLDKEIMFYERISIERHKTEWYYKVNVKGQNNDQPVSFKLTSISHDELVFENPEHDFPTKITYQKIREDSIVAIISGMVEGKDKIEEFPMKRIK